MARNISQVHIDMQYIIRKERGGFVTDAEIDNMLHMGQLDLYEQYWDEYLQSGVLPHPLENFKSRVSFSYADTPGGVLTRPAGYGHYLNGYGVTWNNERQKAIRRAFVPLNESEIDDALNSQLRPIAKTSPAIIQGANSFILYPQEPQAGYIIYLITPVKPVFGYTENGRTITYNSATSVQLAWDDAHINEVMMKALSYIGINLNAQEITEYAENKANQSMA